MDEQKHMKILVAEDQQVSRLILTTYLREWGYDVTEATNGLEALEHIRANGFDFDMLITDWSMMPLQMDYRFSSPLTMICCACPGSALPCPFTDSADTSSASIFKSRYCSNILEIP